MSSTIILPEADDLFEYSKLPSNVVVKTRKDRATTTIDGVLLPLDLTAVVSNYLTVAAISSNRATKWNLPTYLRARWVKNTKKQASDSFPTSVSWNAFGPTIFFEPSEDILSQALTGQTRIQDLIAKTVTATGTSAQQTAYATLSPMVDGMEASDLMEPTRLRMTQLLELCGVPSRVVETPFSVSPTHYQGLTEYVQLFSDRQALVKRHSLWDQLRDLCSAMVFGSIPNREMRDVTRLMPAGSTSLLLRDFWARFIRLNRMALLISVIRLQPQILQYHLLKPILPTLLDFLKRENRGDALTVVETAIAGLERVPLLPPFSHILSLVNVTTAKTLFGDLPVQPWFESASSLESVINQARGQSNDTWDLKGMRTFDSTKLMYDWTTDIATSLTSSFNDYQSLIEAKLSLATTPAQDGTPVVSEWDFPLNIIELGILLNSRFSESTPMRQEADTSTFGLLAQFTRGGGTALTVELRGVDYASFDGTAVSGDPGSVLAGFQPTRPYGTSLMKLSSKIFETEVRDTYPQWYLAGVAALMQRPETFVFSADLGGEGYTVAHYSPYLLHPSERIGEPEVYASGSYILDYLSSRDALSKKQITAQLRNRYLGKENADGERPRYSREARRLRFSARIVARTTGRAALDAEWLDRPLAVFTTTDFTQLMEASQPVEIVDVDNAAGGLKAVRESDPFGDDIFLRPSEGDVFLRRVMLRSVLVGRYAFLRSGRTRLDLTMRSVVTEMLVGHPPAPPSSKLAPVSLSWTGPLLDKVVQIGDEMPPEFFVSPASVRTMVTPSFKSANGVSGAEGLGVSVDTVMTPPPVVSTRVEAQAPPETPASAGLTSDTDVAQVQDAGSDPQT